MFPPAVLIRWIDALLAQLTLHCALWLGPYALMRREILDPVHALALGAQLVFSTLFALLEEVLVQVGDLYDLPALPALREHRTLLPVVDVQGLLVEALVETPTKTTRHLL